LFKINMLCNYSIGASARRSIRSVALYITIGIAHLLFSPLILAQTFPTKPVRLIVPFGPGGGTDIQGRLLGKKFQESTGQTLIVDNRTGAGGMIGAEIAARSPADGYTVLFTTTSLAINLSLQKKLAFDPLKTLTPLTLMSSAPYLLVTHPSVPARTLKGFFDLMRQRGVTMNAASNGSGTAPHLGLEILKQLAGINVTQIHYKGGGPAILAVVSGEVDFQLASSLSSLPHIKSGRLRVLGITSLERSPVFPELPTIASLYPGFSNYNWYGVFLPTGVPKDISQRLLGEFTAALKSPEVRDFISREGGTPIASMPEEFAAYFKSEAEQYEKAIKRGNIPRE
jgi:tripartite-type tricarboxylate transporter receptor subunit TctC